MGIATRPVLVGPATFLLLAKAADGAPAGFRPFDRLDDLVERVRGTPRARSPPPVSSGCSWTSPPTSPTAAQQEIDALRARVQAPGRLPGRPQLFVATYFGELGDALPALLATPVEAIGLDLVAGPGNVDRLAEPGPLPGRTIVAGLVDGHNIWRTDLRAAVATAAAVLGTGRPRRGVHVLLAAARPGRPGRRDRASTRPCASGWRSPGRRSDEVVPLGRALRDGERGPARTAGAAAGRVARRRRVRLAAGGAARPGRGAATYPERAAATGRPAACRRCPPRRSGRSRRPGSCARPAPTLRAGPSTQAAYEEQMRAEIARGHRAAGAARPRRAGARRAGAQRHGAVLRRAAGRVRRHRGTAGSSPTVPAVCARRSSTATSAARRR